MDKEILTIFRTKNDVYIGKSEKIIKSSTLVIQICNMPTQY